MKKISMIPEVEITTAWEVRFQTLFAFLKKLLYDFWHSGWLTKCIEATHHHSPGAIMSTQGTSQEPEMTQEQMIDAVYQFAANEMAAGASDQQVIERLMEKGLDAESAQIVVTNLGEARSKAVQSAGTKNMIYGALWCIGGIVVTAVTYNSAQGGGKYVVAWGAILFGAIQFIGGLVQASKSQ